MDNQQKIPIPCEVRFQKSYATRVFNWDDLRATLDSSESRWFSVERENFTPRSLYQPAPDRIAEPSVLSESEISDKSEDQSFGKPLIWMTTKPSTGFSRRPPTWILCVRFRSLGVCFTIRRTRASPTREPCIRDGARSCMAMGRYAVLVNSRMARQTAFGRSGTMKDRSNPKHHQGRQEERASHDLVRERTKEIASRLQERQEGRTFDRVV